ncbi:hypothetical protein SHIRM173S_12067 [Streptomyces hirsutus]
MSLAPAPLPFLLPRRAAGLVPVLPLVALPALLALPLTYDGAGPADVVSGLVVVYCVIRLLRERRRPLSPTAAVVLGLPVVGLALAAMGASSPEAGFTGLGRYLQVFVLVPAAVLILVRDRTDFRVLAWSFVGLALWQGAVGVHQYVTGTGASYQGEGVRAVGTFGAHDVMGMATAVSLGLVCAVGIALGRAAVWQRVTAAGCAVALLLPLALSFSRGAWIATALTCAVQLVLAGPRRALKVALAVAAAGVILTAGEDTSDVMRVYALGCWGRSLVGTLVGAYFSAGRPSRGIRSAVMGAGIAATSVIERRCRAPGGWRGSPPPYRVRAPPPRPCPRC